jgi:hypothetical protein
MWDFIDFRRQELGRTPILADFVQIARRQTVKIPRGGAAGSAQLERRLGK